MFAACASQVACADVSLSPPAPAAMTRSRTALLCAALLAALARPVAAQIRASELASVSQTIDGTKIAMEYSRPRVRGRKKLFGTDSVVKWNETWTPGANYATTIEANKPFTLDGHAIEKGKYSVWMVTREKGDWTMVLDPDHHRFHTMPPDSNAKQIRFPVHVGKSPAQEILTWSFSGISAGGATLAMDWGTTHIAMAVAVTSSLRMLTPADEAAPFLGRYDFKWTGPDSTKKVQLVTTHKNGYLMATTEPRDEWLVDFALIRVADNWYTLGFFEKGAIYEVERTWVFEFKRDAAGKVTGFEVRDDQDKLQVTGTKRP